MTRIRFILAYCCLLLPFCHFVSAQTVFVVQSSQQWQNTNVSLSSGDNISILGRGVWKRGGSDSDPKQWQGPDGYANQGSTPSDYLAPAANAYSLCAKIGTNGTPFGIGSFYQFTSSSSGNLYLAVNDWPPAYSDNFGYVIAIIYKNPQTTTSISDQSVLPEQAHLSQNYPNPFNPSTVIEFDLPFKSNVQIGIYDIIGRLVRTLVDAEYSVGSHRTVWDGKNDSGSPMPSGTYFYQLKAVNFVQVKKMLYLK